ncbi:MAG: 1-deoxy-D-xylulose-5-phosphate reductoisomerase [Dehalococcoidia bacterium]|nr:1-deoxy-D-xylulose-5-phosphate reductoisomerase [Dehalococcoidia bacterium]
MDDNVKNIVVLGSTGSIGRQTLDIVRAFPDELRVVGLSAWSNRDLLMQQAKEFWPQMVCCESLGEDLPHGCRPVHDLTEMVNDPRVDLVMLAVVGAVGLLPALETLRAGKALALANKEPVVMAGELLTTTAAKHHAPILPVDSEPSAIWQCLHGEDAAKSVRRIIITASGGAFRNSPLSKLAAMTPEEALKHPTWTMGKKITIDSATLMNKAFEVIESHWLFNMPWDRIDAVIHPQSVIHSVVEFEDGSLKAQMGPPDMRFPIQHALFYPRRLPNPNLQTLDLLKVGSLTFEALDPNRYPCFTLGLETAKKGGTYPAVLNAANEEAVSLFLKKEIGFLDIQKFVTLAVERHAPSKTSGLEDILEADAWARRTVRQAVKGA